MSSYVSSDLKWIAMKQLNDSRLQRKQEERLRLLTQLRAIAEANVGDSCTIPQLAEISAAIETFDASQVVPRNPQRRRAFISGWYEDNAIADSAPETVTIARLEFVRCASAEDIQRERDAQRPVDDYHVRRSPAQPNAFVVTANRTHIFCRPGSRYLLECGALSWAELEVTSDVEGCGEHVGLAIVAEESEGGVDGGTAVFAEMAEGTNLWCFRAVTADTLSERDEISQQAVGSLRSAEAANESTMRSAEAPEELTALPEELVFLWLDDDDMPRIFAEAVLQAARANREASLILGESFEEARSSPEVVMELSAAHGDDRVVVFLDQNLDQYEEGSFLGTELCQQIRALGFKGVIIINSANDELQDERDYLLAGADACIGKAVTGGVATVLQKLAFVHHKADEARRATRAAALSGHGS